LFQKNPKERLGYHSPDEVKKHPWFDKISWSTLEQRLIKAPFLPILKSELDLTNFDVTFTNSEIESYQDTGSMSIKENYVGFSFEDEK
jgi:serum/glucocorticoid-regulated kinase 2